MRLLKRILLGLLAFVVLVLVLAIGSVALEVAAGSGRVDAMTNTRIANTNGLVVRAFVARPKTPGTYPAVIMVHEWWGLKPDIISKAEALAQEGYVVIAPDLFRGQSTSSILAAIYQVSTNSSAQVDSDLNAVLSWLTQQSDVQPDRIAIMGFCFGGGTALRYSVVSGKLAATAVFYGTPIADAEQLKRLKGPVLGIFGGADAMIPVASVRAMEAALKQVSVPAQISIYAGQPHAFVQGITEIRQSEPQQQAWNELLKFLKDHLQKPKASLELTAVVAASVASSPSLTFDTLTPARWLHIFVCDVAVQMVPAALAATQDNATAWHR